MRDDVGEQVPPDPSGEAPQPDSGSTRRDTGLPVLVYGLAWHNLPVDPERLRHEHAAADGSFGELEILRAAKRLGVKARAINSSFDRLDKLALPVIARDKDGGFFLIARVGPDKALIQDPANPRPQVISREALVARWSGRLILLATRESLAGAQRRMNWTYFIPSIVKYRRLFLTVLAASAAIQTLALVAPLFTQVVVDKVLVHRSAETLTVLVIAFVAVILFENVLGFLRAYVFCHTTQRVDVELGAQLYHHALHLPLAYYQIRRVGQTVARIRELETIRQFLTSNALTLVIDLAFTVIFFAVMLAYSAKLTLIVALAVPVFAAIVVALSPILRRRVEEKFNRGAESQAFLVESIAGIETAKSMALEPQMQRRWEGLLAAFTLSSFRAQNTASLGSHLIQTVAKLVTAATLYFGAVAVIAGELTVGMYIAFSMFAGHAIAPILRLSQMWQDLQQFRISLARIGDITDTPTEPAWKPGRVSPGRIEGRITFDNVTFAYGPDREPVLKNVSLEIAAGERVGVVGASGSGKSTMGKLINRLYVPTGGRVLIDGTDLALVDTAWLRTQISCVPQENVLFTGTVRDNIAQADPSAPMERVIRAAKLAGAHEFILGLPEGYEAQVEERGMNFSGGQRQRIAIARALFTNPRILILDEATSALDIEAERALIRNMAMIAEGRTVIVIAHRLSALSACRRIVSVESGTVAEDGEPADLLRRGGLFAGLHSGYQSRAGATV